MTSPAPHVWAECTLFNLRFRTGTTYFSPISAQGKTEFVKMESYNNVFRVFNYFMDMVVMWEIYWAKNAYMVNTIIQIGYITNSMIIPPHSSFLSGS